MSDRHGRDPELPQLPPKAKAKLDHLAFREPSNNASKQRQQNLKDEIQKQDKLLQKLRQEQLDLREQCQKQLDMAKRSLFQGRSQRLKRRQVLQGTSQQVWKLLEEMTQELELAIGQDDDEDSLTGEETMTLEDTQEKLLKTVEFIKKQKNAVELEDLEEKDVYRRIEVVEEKIRKLEQEDSNGGEPGVEISAGTGAVWLSITNNDNDIDLAKPSIIDKVIR